MISHLITSKILALIVLFGLTSCFQCSHDEYLYSRYFQKENDDEYLIGFQTRFKSNAAKLDTTLRHSRREERMIGMIPTEPLKRKSKEFVTEYILRSNLEWTETAEQLDSIGIYQTSNDSLLAMMYSSSIEKEYNLKSSTKYTNPFSLEGWTIVFDEKVYKERKIGHVATLTYTLKKLE